MNKARKINLKIFYIIAALALLVGMIPITAVPVSADPDPALVMTLVDPVSGSTTTSDGGYDIAYSTVQVTTANLPQGVTVTGWSLTDVVPLTGSSFVPASVNPGAVNTVQVKGVWGETTINATLSAQVSVGGNMTNTLQIDKKWGKMSATNLTTPTASTFVTWVEASKTFIGNTSATDVVTMNYPDQFGGSHTAPAQGTIMNWFLLAGGTNVPSQVQLSNGTYTSEAGALLAYINGTSYTNGNVTTNFTPALPRARFAYMQSYTTTFLNNNPTPVTTNFTTAGTSEVTVSDINGKSTVNILTTGEEAINIVVIPQYPSPAQDPVIVEQTPFNFKTQEMEVVPQVRWSGEKIVLEKNFGKTFADGNYAVKFSLENQSPGELSAIGPLPSGSFRNSNLFNTTQTVWSVIDSNGLASCILENDGVGECDVTASLYTVQDNNLIMENQHAFVVYYLKLESLILGNVVGKRAGHNTGDWTLPNPWDPTLDIPPSNNLGASNVDTLNVSQDALLRARVRGWFTNSNPSSRGPGFVNIGSPDGIGLALPAGRWILPDDWATLAGPVNWTERRLHWDIMNTPSDGLAGVTSTNTLGNYTKGSVVKATAPVIGPFSPGLELMTPTGWATPNKFPKPTGTPVYVDPARAMQTVVPDGNLNTWDAPMPPAKIVFEINKMTATTDNAGFFKSAFKDGIYYVMSGTTKVYTNPFYYEMIPAHEAIPAFINNGGYDWDSFMGTSIFPIPQTGIPYPQTSATPYGPYRFWQIINQPDGPVATSDPSGHPTKVEVYSDNHGEAMVYLNGNWNLDLSAFNVKGAADIQPGAQVGTTTVQATADYPYIRVHQAIFSNVVEKVWLWGGVVLGWDSQKRAASPYVPRMVLSIVQGPYTIGNIPSLQGTAPNQAANSFDKMAWIWVTDRDGLQAGVLGAKVQWQVDSLSGTTISDVSTSGGIDSYNTVTQNINLDHGFLVGTSGQKTDANGNPVGANGLYGVSYLRAPTTYEAQLFNKFWGPTGVHPIAGADPSHYAVAAIDLIAPAQVMTDVTEYITSPDFGLTPGTSGTVIYYTNIDFSGADPLDDAPRYGDANMDGTVNMGDVTKIERMILGLDPPNINAMTRQVGTIDMGDVVKVERMILGLN